MLGSHLKGHIIIDNVNYNIKCKLDHNPSKDRIKFLEGCDQSTQIISMKMYGQEYFVNFSKESDHKFKVNVQGSDQEYICLVPDGWSNYVMTLELGKRSKTVHKKEKCPCGSGKKFKFCCLKAGKI